MLLCFNVTYFLPVTSISPTLPSLCSSLHLRESGSHFSCFPVFHRHLKTISIPRSSKYLDGCLFTPPVMYEASFSFQTADISSSFSLFAAEALICSAGSHRRFRTVGPHRAVRTCSWCGLVIFYSPGLLLVVLTHP